MRVLLATVGSRGDVQPFVALAMGLRDAGHTVAICTCPKFREFVVGHGIEFLHLDDGLLRLLESDLGRKLLQNLTGVVGLLKTMPRVIKQIGPIQKRMVDDCWAAVETFRPDAIVFHSKLFCVPSFAAVRNIPAILTMFCPLLVPTGDFPLFGPSLGSTWNRGTYRIARWITAAGTRGYMRDWRSRFDKAGASNASSPSRVSTSKSVPVMHAYSETLSSRPADWPDAAMVSGYWFMPQDNLDGNLDRVPWKPSSELVEFLRQGPAPVYFGFGSMAGDSARITRNILSAISKTDLRAVLATGWGGIDLVPRSEKVFVIDSVPHEWLFPQMAAVVHHGGAGTTAAGLAAGCPTVISPFGLDQPFWGRCVEKRGAGLKIPSPSRVTDDQIAKAIIQVTREVSYRDAARTIQSQLVRERGVERAIEMIEAIASTWRISPRAELSS
ncbi:glycosyltransferase [Pirellulaceae bacterium SH501]